MSTSASGPASRPIKNGGDNDQLADLGIGFVQNIGDGMSGADMPASGTATFKGNWVAAVQPMHSCAIKLERWRCDADRGLRQGRGQGVTWTGLATLEGAIDGNGFVRAPRRRPSADNDMV